MAFVLLGAGALHIGATALWLTPTNPIREAAQGELSEYLQPFFRQNWNLFAPNPATSNPNLLVRAQVRDVDSGELVETEWFNVTAFETAQLTHNPTPSRLVKTSHNVYRRYASQRSNLDSDQRAVLSEDYTTGSAWEEIRQGLRDEGLAPGRTRLMVRAEQTTTAYATAVARALWGSDVVAVQYRLFSVRIAPFERRHDPDFEPSTGQTTLGWRPTWTMRNHDQEVFNAIFAGALG